MVPLVLYRSAARVIQGNLSLSLGSAVADLACNVTETSHAEEHKYIR